MAVAARYSLGENRRAVEATLAAERLLAPDDLWTNYLAEATPDNADDRARLKADLPALMELAGQIRAAITDAAERAGELRLFVESLTSDEVDEAYGAVMHEYSAAAEFAERLPELRWSN